MCPSLGLGVTAGMLYLDAAIQGCCPYEARNGGWEEGAGSSSLPSIPTSRQPSKAWLFPSLSSQESQHLSAASGYLQGFLNVSLNCPPCCTHARDNPSHRSPTLCPLGQFCTSCPNPTSLRD